MFENSSNPILPLLLFAKCLNITFGSISDAGSSLAFFSISATASTVLLPPGIPGIPGIFAIMAPALDETSEEADYNEMPPLFCLMTLMNYSSLLISVGKPPSFMAKGLTPERSPLIKLISPVIASAMKLIFAFVLANTLSLGSESIVDFTAYLSIT